MEFKSLEFKIPTLKPTKCPVFKKIQICTEMNGRERMRTIFLQIVQADVGSRVRPSKTALQIDSARAFSNARANIED
jgi:hypothetical protein